MTLLDHFGWIAPYYDRVIRTDFPEKLMKQLKLPVTGRVLDAGGGTGRIAQAFVPYTGQMVVADLSLKMLREAGKKEGIAPVCCQVEYLPFAEGAFDRVIMVDAFHHVINQQKTANELLRVVKPGGRLVIEEPDVRTLSVKLLAVGEKLLLMRSHFKDPSQIARLYHGKVRVDTEGYNAWITVFKD